MLKSVLRLSLCRGIGPRLGLKLLNQFNNPETIFSPRAPLPDRLAKSLRDPQAVRATEAELAEAARRGITFLHCLDPRYPELLREIPDPPLVLRIWGELRREDQLAVAVVGTRRPTAYGRRQAIRFARALSGRGFAVVSGLARGIDAIAHEEALRCGNRTVAVLGSGLGRIYPSEHRNLAERISRRGAVVSEFPILEPPLGHHFPRRNRIISGLSLAVLVVEGGKKSGAVITADCAAEQGRNVFAVPGPVDSPASAGVNELIRDGAFPALEPEDILRELGSAIPEDPEAPDRVPPPPPPTGNEAEVLRYLPLGPVDPDTAAREAGLSLGETLAALTGLELKGYLRRFGGSLERVR